MYKLTDFKTWCQEPNHLGAIKREKLQPLLDKLTEEKLNIWLTKDLPEVKPNTLDWLLLTWKQTVDQEAERQKELAELAPLSASEEEEEQPVLPLSQSRSASPRTKKFKSLIDDTTSSSSDSAASSEEIEYQPLEVRIAERVIKHLFTVFQEEEIWEKVRKKLNLNPEGETSLIRQYQTLAQKITALEKSLSNPNPLPLFTNHWKELLALGGTVIIVYLLLK